MAIKTIFLSEQAVVAMLLSAIEAYEDLQWMFDGEYFSDEAKKKPFDSPQTLYEAMRRSDEKDVSVNLFIKKSYRQRKHEPSECAGYILGIRERSRLLGFISLPYQIAEREYSQVTPLHVIKPNMFTETLTAYKVIGSFHSHPYLPEECKQKRIQESYAKPSQTDRD
ncbi:Mov34/MPN/PAD-1 family protein, partial [Candidatus Bathyarchaeota archaeon]|nr:Mov34/MPN/PAD-1 family protein [Candidatus Bathyarchaeota archaeon]